MFLTVRKAVHVTSHSPRSKTNDDATVLTYSGQQQQPQQHQPQLPASRVPPPSKKMLQQQQPQQQLGKGGKGRGRGKGRGSTAPPQRAWDWSANRVASKDTEKGSNPVPNQHLWDGVEQRSEAKSGRARDEAQQHDCSNAPRGSGGDGVGVQAQVIIFFSSSFACVQVL